MAVCFRLFDNVDGASGGGGWKMKKIVLLLK